MDIPDKLYRNPDGTEFGCQKCMDTLYGEEYLKHLGEY